jgi:DNA-binding NtrC family response regulator
MNGLNVLILDDDNRIRNEITEFLNNLKYNCFEADKPSSAQVIIDQKDIDLIILDVNLPEKSGLAYLKELKEKNSDLEVIVITGQADINNAVQALRLGAIDFLNKPFRLVDLESAICRTKRYMELASTVKHANDRINLINDELKKITEINFIGNSPASQKIIENIYKVAESQDTPVLITGESGTGKELVARSIHLLSSRAKNCFLPVNSSAITESLFESELFGYKKGAFTGAIESKAGWFEIANKGTLFLDEISEMNFSLQAKMLRVLEDKKVRRIGSDTETEVNVRVVSASNKNFEEEIEQKKFRQDLFYRLAVFTIHLLPLRERKEDIPLLVEYYIKFFAEKMNKKISHIESSLFDELVNYSFPGNIRELRNMAERALIVSTNQKITLKDFPVIKLSLPCPNFAREESLDLDFNEKKLILKALEKAGNNKSIAAKLLNITWQSLDRRLTKFGIAT